MKLNNLNEAYESVFNLRTALVDGKNDFGLSDMTILFMLNLLGGKQVHFALLKKLLKTYDFNYRLSKIKCTIKKLQAFDYISQCENGLYQIESQGFEYLESVNKRIKEVS